MRECDIFPEMHIAMTPALMFIALLRL